MNVSVPTYDLYGEQRQERSRFWIHGESIPSRSRLHRWEIKTHRHEQFFQILYMRGGTGEAVFDGTTHLLAVGTLVLVPPGFAHGFRFSRDVDGLVITFVASRLAGLMASEAFAEPRRVAIDPSHPDRAYLGETLDRLGRALAAGDSALSEPYLTAALLLIRGMLAADDEQPNADRRMQRLTTLIAAHAREHRPVSFYASTLGISPTHLNRLVLAATGRTTSDLIADVLLDEARRLLVFTGLSVNHVAGNLGFSDPAYFSRFFSSRAGVTPRAYRDAERAKLSPGTD